MHYPEGPYTLLLAQTKFPQHHPGLSNAQEAFSGAQEVFFFKSFDDLCFFDSSKFLTFVAEHNWTVNNTKRNIDKTYVDFIFFSFSFES